MADRAAALQITTNDHPPFGDLLLAYQAAFRELDMEVQTISLAPSYGEPVAGVEYLDLPPGSSNRAGGRLLDERVRSRPFLTICHRYRAYRVLRASGVEPARVVAVAHDHGFFKRLQRRLEQRLFARDVLFAGVSPAVQADLAAAVPDPLCLPNALDLRTLDAERLSRDKALGVLGASSAEDAFTVGCVGRLISWKRPGLALDALKRLKQDGHNVRLLVVGDGPMRSELEAEAADLPVTFTGFVPGARRLMSAFDALLLTSTPREAFAMVVLEAMASRLPVVSGIAPGPQFVLGGTGFYYQDADGAEIARVLEQVAGEKASGTLEERLAKARARAEREFSVEALAGRLRELRDGVQ